MTTHRPTRSALTALFMGVILSVPLVGTASAHSSLVRANIKPGAVFAHGAYPRTITAFFSENVKPTGSWVHVFEDDPRGDHGMVDTGVNHYPFTNSKEITATLPKGLKGRYTLIWFTTSVDDAHKAGNSFTFSVK